jgi:hypothetical protein
MGGLEIVRMRGADRGPTLGGTAPCLRGIGAVILSFVCACGSDARSTSSSDPPAAPVPQTEAERGAAEAREATARVEQLERDLAAVDARLTAATNAVVDATTDTARADAKDRLVRLRRDRAQLEQQLAQAKRARCLTEPTAPGCT